MNPPLTTIEAALFALVVFIAVLGLLVLLAAPMEWKARRDARFAERLDRLSDWIFDR